MAGASAGSVAAPRARAKLRRRAPVRLRLHRFHGLSVVHRFEDPAELRPGRARELHQAVRAAELVDRAAEPRDLRRPVHRPVHRDGVAARDPARSEDPRRRGAPPDLSLSDGAVVHRHRHRLEVVPRPRHRGGAGGPRLGLRELRVRLDQGPRLRDLLRGDRRSVAVDRLRHGDVPGRAARHRQRDHQGGADRRRLGHEALSPDRHPAACARRSCPPSSCWRTWRSSPTTS